MAGRAEAMARAGKPRAQGPGGEIGGAFGDLGTLLPYALGALTIGGMAPAGVLAGFGAFLIASGLFFAIPIAVQPMKAVGAAMLTGGLRPDEIAAAGIMLGGTMLLLGATGLLPRVARLVPQSVTAGLQLGLGIAMAAIGFGLAADGPWIGFGTLAVVLLLLRLRGVPAVPVALALAIAAGLAAGVTPAPGAPRLGLTLPSFALPDWPAFADSFATALLPQLPLTLTNAVIVTAALSRALFADGAPRASERNLALSTGLGNLILAPFGAFPMCHGAGGLQAQYRFGARTGLAPVILGVVLLAFGLGLADSAAALLATIPREALGALLVIAGVDLALSRRLFDARRDCWPAIATTAAVTALTDPALGLAVGWTMELTLRPAVRLARRLLRPGAG